MERIKSALGMGALTLWGLLFWFPGGTIWIWVLLRSAPPRRLGLGSVVHRPRLRLLQGAILLTKKEGP